MSYKMALEAAGAQVQLFQEFGDYQGTWFAKVIYHGKAGWVSGAFGSCSGCDAFRGEFEFVAHDHNGKETWLFFVTDDDWEPLLPNCAKCNEVKMRLAALGKNYLDDMLTQQQAEALASENIDWDMDAVKMLEFVKANAIK